MVVVLDGLFVPSRFGLGMAAAEVGCGMVGAEANRPVVVGNGLLTKSQVGAGLAPVEIEPAGAGVEADRLGAIGDGFFKPVQTGLIKTEASPVCCATAVVRREGTAADL